MAVPAVPMAPALCRQVLWSTWVPLACDHQVWHTLPEALSVQVWLGPSNFQGFLEWMERPNIKSQANSTHIPSENLPLWANLFLLFKSATLCKFCNASTRVHTAMVYIVLKTEMECVSQFVAAKTRVAPLQGQTVPWLELLSAFFLSSSSCQCISACRFSFCTWTYAATLTSTPKLSSIRSKETLRHGSPSSRAVWMKSTPRYLLQVDIIVLEAQIQQTHPQGDTQWMIYLWILDWGHSSTKI